VQITLWEWDLDTVFAQCLEYFAVYFAHQRQAVCELT
jgi:hypothetical protein